MTAVIRRSGPSTEPDAIESTGLDEAPEVTVAERATAPDVIDLDLLAQELDAIRDQVLDSLGQRDADYLRGVLRLQRSLELGGRAALWVGVFPPAWLAGTAMLSLSKILENMEIGHNVMHAQWDWLRDDRIHSTTWEWDNVCPSRQWRHTHNHVHHQWTNVSGKDRDIGYGVLRIDESQQWHPRHLAQPLYFVLLAALFEYGVSLHDLESDFADGERPTVSEMRPKLAETLAKVRDQALKDYVGFPLLSLPFGLPGVIAAATGAAAANVVRNLWSFTVIFCGHFPDDVTVFTQADVEGESRGGWYRRQILGSANFRGGPLMHLMAGNLDHQIEHHLFPDLPSNRYAEIAPQVREVCERHGLAYNTGSLAGQFATVVRKVLRFSLPFT
ncbi:MAG: fatty acid desaturase family protein, partial [Microthrixaceae bacterium]